MKLCVWVWALANIFAILALPAGAFSPREFVKSHMESLYSLRDRLSGANQKPGGIVDGEETGQVATTSMRTTNTGGSNELSNLRDGTMSDFPSLSPGILGDNETSGNSFLYLPKDVVPTETHTPSVKPLGLMTTAHTKIQSDDSYDFESGALYAVNRPKSGVMQSLFEIGHRDILDTNAKPQEEEMPSFEAIFKNLPFLSLTYSEDSPPASGRESIDNSLMKYLDTVRENAWGQFKSLAIGYTNLLEEEYKLQDFADQLPIDLVKKVLDLGDHVNFLHLVGKRVDPGLAKYLADQLDPLLSRMRSLNPASLMGNSTSEFFGGMLRKAAWKTLNMFISHVSKVAERFVPRGEFAVFQEQLAKSSPIAAKGLDFILNGPDRVEGLLSGRSLVAEGRQYGQDYHQSYGYGGYGAYDDSYGHTSSYGSGVYLDPYLILGGIGAAALLAFLAYRLIVTTGGGARSVDLTFMDLSDMPTILSNFYNLVESAEEKYDDVGKPFYEENVPNEDTSELVKGLNALWLEREEGNNCVSCSLFEFVKDRLNLGMNDVESLLMTGVANLLGAERPGQLVDEVAVLLPERGSVTCERIGNRCHVR